VFAEVIAAVVVMDVHCQKGSLYIS
jgi:hypothetical protein